jgi:hypothetical protein
LPDSGAFSAGRQRLDEGAREGCVRA